MPMFTVVVNVPMKPPGKNRDYIPSRHGKTGYRILSPEARKFRVALQDEARRVKKAVTWPTLDKVEDVYMAVYVFNTRHDEGAATALVKDSLEDVFYENDRVVRGTLSLALKNPLIEGPLVSVVVTTWAE